MTDNSVVNMLPPVGLVFFALAPAAESVCHLRCINAICGAGVPVGRFLDPHSGCSVHHTVASVVAAVWGARMSEERSWRREEVKRCQMCHREALRHCLLVSGGLKISKEI